MEIPLSAIEHRCPPPIAECYQLLAWREELLASHAEAKFRSFEHELDVHVFPCLGQRDGCWRLMNDISGRANFVPEATWLIRYRRPQGGWENCGTIQGLADGDHYGAIQNVGVTPAHRGRGLGTRLLYEALAGFRRAGLQHAYLEVTAQNTGAVRLYERFGFRVVRTLYKVSEVTCGE
jgi:hypothetical protein